MKKRILVVDDDPTNLKSVETVLTSHGYEVKTTTHAEDIEERTKNFNPHLIVMDLMMPKVDGHQAAQRLQKNPLLSNIPVVFLTGLKMNDDARQEEFEVSVENKSYRTLTKPFNAKTLITEIDNLVTKEK